MKAKLNDKNLLGTRVRVKQNGLTAIMWVGLSITPQKLVLFV